MPARFEDEYPEEAATMQMLFRFNHKLRFHVALFGDVNGGNQRRVPCPCGSGIKSKKCHPQWLKS